MQPTALLEIDVHRSICRFGVSSHHLKASTLDKFSYVVENHWVGATIFRKMRPAEIYTSARSNEVLGGAMMRLIGKERLVFTVHLGSFNNVDHERR